MRPKHGRHSYKNAKFRKRYPETNYNLYSEWLRKVFLPEYLDRGSGYKWNYKRIRKIYNAWYKKIKTTHKKNNGFMIGDQFWLRCKDE